MTDPALPGGYLRARLRPVVSHLIGLLAKVSRRRGQPNDPLRVLILTYEPELGSILAMTAMLRVLKQTRPTAKITVAGLPLLAETLRHNPFIDGLIGTPHPCRSLTLTLWNCARALVTRSEAYDWVIVTEGNRHNVRTGLLSVCIRSAYRGGLAASTVLPHYDHSVRFDPSVSMAVNNLRALTPLGVQPDQREPEIFFSEAAYESTRGALSRAGIDPTRPIAVFATQASGRQPVAWPADRFAAAADRLSSQAGLQPVFVGTGDDREPIAAILEAMETLGVSLAGHTSVPELAALCAMADLVVTIDTGPLHVARGVGAPTVLLASGWQGPHHWLPQNVPTCTTLRRAEACRPPCRKGVCAEPACMAAIAVDDILEAAGEMLARFPPLAGRRARIASRISTIPAAKVGRRLF